MHKRTLFSTLMLPVLAALLLLPPLSCLIFQQTATQNAYSDAGKNLQALNQSVLPLINGTFNTSRQNEMSENTIGFLRKISNIARNEKGNAKIIILESRLHVIFPYDEDERAALADFSALCIDHIPDEGKEPDFVKLTDNSGERYLVQYYRLPTDSKRISYLIAYCSVSQIDAWVSKASIQVLMISVGFVMPVFFVLFFAIRRVSKPLKRLAAGVTAIGEGSFVQIEPSFALRELEEVRSATNSMSQRLQKAEQVQKDFLQNVSHELRNPLMSIGGYAQGIERDIFSSPKAAAHTILDESTRLTELVNGLLTLSRLENESQAIPLEKLRVLEPIQDCLDRANGIALQKKVELILQPFPLETCAIANEELLSQVLDNLLSNAIRYAKSTVTVSVDRSDDTVSIRVLDDGNGIVQADLPHLFERCYKGKGGHFGIGLAIAASSAEKMKGSLCAANREDGGAVFTLQVLSSQ